MCLFHKTSFPTNDIQRLLGDWAIQRVGPEVSICSFGAGKRSGLSYSSRMADSTLARMSWGISLTL